MTEQAPQPRPLPLPPLTTWRTQTGSAHRPDSCSDHPLCVLLALASAVEDHLETLSTTLAHSWPQLTPAPDDRRSLGREALGVLDALGLRMLDAADTPAIASEQPVICPTQTQRPDDERPLRLCLEHAGCTLRTCAAKVAWEAQHLGRLLEQHDDLSDRAEALADSIGRRINHVLVGHLAARLHRRQTTRNGGQR